MDFLNGSVDIINIPSNITDSNDKIEEYIADNTDYSLDSIYFMLGNINDINDLTK